MPQVAPGELLVIVGTVGAGKSSLLAGILGEMLLTQARMHLFLCEYRLCIVWQTEHTKGLSQSASAASVDCATVMSRDGCSPLRWPTLADAEGVPADANSR